MLTGVIAARVKELIGNISEVNRWAVQELNVMEDHVHLMLQIWPRESVGRVMQMLKGRSSRILRVEFPELEEFSMGDSFWADGYFAETVGKADEEIIRRYIQNQRQPSFAFRK